MYSSSEFGRKASDKTLGSGSLRYRRYEEVATGCFRRKHIRYVEILLVASCFKSDNLELARVAVHYRQCTRGVHKNIVEEF